MRGTGRYVILGLSVVLISMVFVHFSDEENIEYDYTGIVSDVREGENGFTFHLHTSGRVDIRCFSEERPAELGYYAVKGDMSDDGGILFVSAMMDLDARR